MTPIQFANRWLFTPYVWGESDCALSVCDWVLHKRGVDPAEGLRLTYSSKGECERVTRFFSKPLGITSERFEGAGLRNDNIMEPGHIGVLKLGRLPILGLCLDGKNWAMRLEDSGVKIVKWPNILKAWAI